MKPYFYSKLINLQIRDAVMTVFETKMTNNKISDIDTYKKTTASEHALQMKPPAKPPAAKSETNPPTLHVHVNVINNVEVQVTIFFNQNTIGSTCEVMSALV